MIAESTDLHAIKHTSLYSMDVEGSKTDEEKEDSQRGGEVKN